MSASKIVAQFFLHYQLTLRFLKLKMPHVVPSYSIRDSITDVYECKDKNRLSWYDEFRRYVYQVRDRVRRTTKEDYICPIFADCKERIPDMEKEAERSGIDSPSSRWYERVYKAPLRGKCHIYWRLLLAYRIREESWIDQSCPVAIPDPSIVCYFCGQLIRRCAEESYAIHLVHCANFEKNMDLPDDHEDKLVQCPYAGGHFVPPVELENHKANCIWRKFIEGKIMYTPQINFDLPYPLLVINKPREDKLRCSENAVEESRLRKERRAKEWAKYREPGEEPALVSTGVYKKKYEYGDDNEEEEYNHLGKWMLYEEHEYNGIDYYTITPPGPKKATP